MRPCGIALLLTLACAAGAAADPSPGGPRSGDGQPYEIGRDLCWEDPADMEGWEISSEIISRFGLESETANDFMFDQDATVTHCAIIAGEYNTAPGDPHFTVMNFKFYDDAGDRPGVVIAEYLHVTPAITFLGDDPNGDPIYQFDLDVSVPVIGNARYWFVIQADDHDFPPQWGRRQAIASQGLEAMILSPFFGFDEWTPLSQIEGGNQFPPPRDVAQAFECTPAVAVAPTTWGRVKGLYR